MDPEYELSKIPTRKSLKNKSTTKKSPLASPRVRNRDHLVGAVGADEEPYEASSCGE